MEYRNGYYYWENIKIVLRLIILFICEFYDYDIKIKGSLTFIIIMIYWLL